MKRDMIVSRMGWSRLSLLGLPIAPISLAEDQMSNAVVIALLLICMTVLVFVLPTIPNNSGRRKKKSVSANPFTLHVLKVEKPGKTQHNVPLRVSLTSMFRYVSFSLGHASIHFAIPGFPFRTLTAFVIFGLNASALSFSGSSRRWS